MACDEFTESIYELVVELANADIIKNMDDAAKYFEGMGIDRATLASAIVEVEAFNASKRAQRIITNIAEIKAEAGIESRLREKLSQLQNELGTIDPDTPVGAAKRKRINKTIEALRKELKQEKERIRKERAEGRKEASAVARREKRIRDLGSSIENLEKEISRLEAGGTPLAPTPRPAVDEGEEIEELKELLKVRRREKSLLEQIHRWESMDFDAIEDDASKEPQYEGPVNQRIRTLEKQRDEARTRAKLMREINDLQRQLQTGKFTMPMAKVTKQESREVQNLRAEKASLQRRIQSSMHMLNRIPPSIENGTLGSWGWWGENVLGAWKTSRASIDWSMVLRQGFKYFQMHPIESFKKFPGTLKATFSEEFFRDSHKQLVNSSEYQWMEAAGLSITDPDGELTDREDAFAQTGWLESSKITNVLLVGKAIRASNRAYTHYLNEIRAKYFMDLARAVRPGNQRPSPEDLKTVARWVNIVTGRGEPGDLARAGEALNYLFFSYRYTLSQFQFIEDMFRFAVESFTETSAGFTSLATGEKGRISGSKAARRVIAKEYGRLALANLAMSSLGLMFNYSQFILLGENDDEDDPVVPVNESGIPLFLDPRSSEFQKWRVGSRRIDMNGGLSQALNITAKLVSGTNIIMERDAEDRYKVKYEDMWTHRNTIMGIGTFISNKMHPALTFTWDYGAGTTRYDKVQTRDGWAPKPEWIASELIPFWNSLYVQEAKDIVVREGVSKQEWMAAGILLGIGFLGAGTYDKGLSPSEKAEKEKEEAKKAKEEADKKKAKEEKEAEKQRAREEKEREREEKRKKREEEKERKRKEREKAEEERRNRPKPIAAKTLISKIKAAKTQEELDKLVPEGEDRITVLRARDAKREQLFWEGR